MNRSKHPDRAPYKRKNTPTDRTRNFRQWRVEGAWNHRPNSPSAFVTQDEPQAHRVAERWASQGAYVIIERHKGDLRWRTVREIDGPALAAEAAMRERRQRAALARRAQDRADALTAQRERTRAAIQAQTTVNRAERRQRALDRLARVMVQPPVPRDATGRVTARHTTGGTR